jgi:nitrogen fixation/metabolism regulation signal transduction histidine kinase
MLHAVIAVPVLAQGEVIAILTAGRRITGVPYSRREVETLFDLATQMAATIRHLRLHHQVQYEKAYTERVLSQMSSGLVSIDEHEKVTVMNRRAEQILGISAGEVVNNDLRRLPSPLGDLLYDSLRTGRTTQRLEVQLASPKLPLEVSTYPIAGPGPALGAALFFEDLSAAKHRAAQKRLREQFELLARLVARLAADIRRPLVSVQTFMELFEERFDEPEFRERFVRVMKDDAGQLVQMFEKLSALVSEGEFTFETIEIRMIVDECLAELDARPEPEGLDGTGVLSFSDVASRKRALVKVRAKGDDLIVKCDRAQLKKAILYLLWYLVGKSPSAEAQLSMSVGGASQGDSRVQLLVSSSSAELRPNEVERLFDLLQAVEGSLVELGPFISRKILEAHNGGLQVAQRGRQVTFVMELPLAPR